MAERLAEVELDSIKFTESKHRELGFRHSHSDVSRVSMLATVLMYLI